MSESNGFVTAAALDQFANRRNYEAIEIPGFGKFRLRGWLGTERGQYADLCEKANGTQRTAIAIALSVVDASNELVFNTHPEAIAKLSTWPMAVLEPLERTILRMNGMDFDIEELAGNWSAATSGDSGSN